MAAYFTSRDGDGVLGDRLGAGVGGAQTEKAKSDAARHPAFLFGDGGGGGGAGVLGSDAGGGRPQPVELVALCVVCVVCLCMQGFTATRAARAYGDIKEHASFLRLRRRYNIVYILGTFGDWIQGAYLYALYREHGFSMADIGYIFVLGYFASASFGTYISSLGDTFGYRRFVITYGVVYGAACVLMRSSAMELLVLSRVMSGVAYSLLFSSFESWAISEADRLRLDRRYLIQLFSSATFFNAMSAVTAGLVGNLVVDLVTPVRFGSGGSGGGGGSHFVGGYGSGGGGNFVREAVIAGGGGGAGGGEEMMGLTGVGLTSSYASATPTRSSASFELSSHHGYGDKEMGGGRRVLHGATAGRDGGGEIEGRGGGGVGGSAVTGPAVAQASTLMYPRNMYTPAFDAGAVALVLCALAARLLWVDRNPQQQLRSGHSSAGSNLGTPGGDGGGGAGGRGGNAGDAAEAGGAEVGAGTCAAAAAVAGGGQPELEQGIWRAARMVFAKPELLSLGISNSLYEAALHVFVFVWTPALERRGPKLSGGGGFLAMDPLGRPGAGAGPAVGAYGSVNAGVEAATATALVSAVPHGLVFSLFMACKMAGSQLYLLIGERAPASATLRVVFFVSLLCFIVPLLVDDYALTLASFCAFEFGLGLYWPAMAVMRAELVPNHLRATMTSVFRVPLNLLVMACLACAGNVSEPSFFMMCAGMMATCLFFVRHRTPTRRGGMGPGVGQDR